MSKFDLLWVYVKESNQESLKLSFSDVEKIAGIPIDHSFLTYKKELEIYGYIVKKISLKEQTVIFEKII